MAPSPARVSWIAAISLIVLAICIAPTPATAQNAAAESLFADGERLLAMPALFFAACAITLVFARRKPGAP